MYIGSICISTVDVYFHIFITIYLIIFTVLERPPPTAANNTATGTIIDRYAVL